MCTFKLDSPIDATLRDMAHTPHLAFLLSMSRKIQSLNLSSFNQLSWNEHFPCILPQLGSKLTGKMATEKCYTFATFDEIGHNRARYLPVLYFRRLLRNKPEDELLIWLATVFVSILSQHMLTTTDHSTRINILSTFKHLNFFFIRTSLQSVRTCYPNLRTYKALFHSYPNLQTYKHL